MMAPCGCEPLHTSRAISGRTTGRRPQPRSRTQAPGGWYRRVARRAHGANQGASAKEIARTFAASRACAISAHGAREPDPRSQDRGIRGGTVAATRVIVFAGGSARVEFCVPREFRNIANSFRVGRIPRPTEGRRLRAEKTEKKWRVAIVPGNAERREVSGTESGQLVI